MNVAVFNGNLTRDPEVKKIKDNLSVTKFNVAINNGYMKDGEFVSEPVFVEVNAWGAVGERVGEKYKKGDGVLVNGRLRFEQWETDGGEKRSKLTVTANQVELVRPKGGKPESTPTEESGEPALTSDDSEDVPF